MIVTDTLNNAHPLFSPQTRQVGQNNLAHSYMAFCTCYADTGLWGLYLTAEPGRLPKLMQAVNREFTRLCESITDEEVERAKIRVRGSCTGFHVAWAYNIG